MHELRMNKQLCLAQTMAEEAGLKRQSYDMSEITEYGKHFLAFRSAHGFVMYNGSSQWSKSNALTCWNPKVIASTVDYLWDLHLL